MIALALKWALCTATKCWLHCLCTSSDNWICNAARACSSYYNTLRVEGHFLFSLERGWDAYSVVSGLGLRLLLLPSSPTPLKYLLFGHGMEGCLVLSSWHCYYHSSECPFVWRLRRLNDNLHSILVGLLYWNYYLCVITDPGGVPNTYVRALYRVSSLHGFSSLLGLVSWAWIKWRLRSEASHWQSEILSDLCQVQASESPSL